MDPWKKRREPSFWESVMLLVGHIAGSCVLFMSLVGAAWLLGVAVHALHLKHPFDPSVLKVITGVELALVYVDIALSGVVLLVGAVRFIKELSGER